MVFGCNNFVRRYSLGTQSPGSVRYAMHAIDLFMENNYSVAASEIQGKLSPWQRIKITGL
jgi:hypothetical protein